MLTHGARALIGKHPQAEGEWWSQKNYVIIHCQAMDASEATLKQSGHHLHYDTELTISRYFQSNVYHLAQYEYEGVNTQYCCFTVI